VPTLLAALLLILALQPAFAGDAEVKAAQGIIASQLKSFADGRDAEAYGYAAPGIKRIFPTLESFMGMVTGAYRPVYKPRSYSFGKAEEATAGSVMQQVFVVGPDGKDYEAVYTLELQPDGSFRITGVSLRAASTVGT